MVAQSYQYSFLGEELSVIGGGLQNKLYKTPLSFIGAGSKNLITGQTHSFIGGGESNTISANTHGVIVGGIGNLLTMAPFYHPQTTGKPVYKANVIAGGWDNTISGCSISFMGSGMLNKLKHTLGSSIVAGSGNTINLGGTTGPTNTAGDNSFIGAGVINTITPVSGSGIVNHAIQSAIVGGSKNLISGGTGSMVGTGSNNQIYTSQSSFIGSGSDNIIQGHGYTAPAGTGATIAWPTEMHTSIVGGQANLSNNTKYGFIGGGWRNTISGGHRTSIVGGSDNNIKDFSGSTIGGGSWNTITTYFNPSAAGAQPFQNTKNQVDSFIGNGKYNTISGASYSVIVGGSGNTINPASTTGATGLGDGLSGVTSFIGTGFDNYISGATQSSILNGSHNIIKFSSIDPDFGSLPDYTARLFWGPARKDLLILAGDHNQITDYGPQDIPAGVRFNYTTPRKSTIINGRHNLISGSNASTIVNGKANTITNNGWDLFGENTILNGSGNTIDEGWNCWIGAGSNNSIKRIKVGSNGPTMTGGMMIGSWIGSGYMNMLSGVTYSTILNGEGNAITRSEFSTYNAILNGHSNNIGTIGSDPTKPRTGDMRHATIVGGASNEIQGWSRGAMIGGGQDNKIPGGGGRYVGDTSNCLYPGLSGVSGWQLGYTNNTFIGSGWKNAISGQSATAFIGAGWQNTIFQSNFAVIVGGYRNRIFRFSNNCALSGQSSGATIVGGHSNDIFGNIIGASIVGGYNNKIVELTKNNTDGYGWAQPYVVVSGSSVKGHYSFIGGGIQNKVSGSSWSSIVGGSGNTISAYTKTNLKATVSAAYSFLGGGSGNTIGAASGATILGGARNEILPFATHSHILGGTGNTVLGTATSSAILGCNDLTASIANTTYMCALTASTISAQSFCIVDATGTVTCLDNTAGIWSASTQLANGIIASATTVPGGNGFARVGIQTDQPASMFTLGNNNVAVGGNHNSITWSGGTVKLGLQAGYKEGITNKVPGAEHNNAWIGWKAGYANETGGGNVGIGPEALSSVIAGSGHTAIGIKALKKSISNSK